jgi:proline iminopeptidase
MERKVRLKSGHQLYTRTSPHGTIPIILIHGGPGSTHELFGSFESFLAPLGFKVIVYDQLDSYYSDKPSDQSLWTIDRFTEEIEEIRQQLNLDKIYLLGYSWGVVLAIEYALKYQQNLRGLILNGLAASGLSWQNRMQELRTTLPPHVQELLTKLEEKNHVGSTEWNECLKTYFYSRYFCQLSPMPTWCAQAMAHLNRRICLHFCGPNDFIVTGALKDWDRWNDLPAITVPTFIIIGESDLCSISDAQKMAQLIPNSTAVIIPQASHMPFEENQEQYFTVLGTFLTNTRKL